MGRKTAIRHWLIVPSANRTPRRRLFFLRHTQLALIAALFPVVAHPQSITVYSSQQGQGLYRQLWGDYKEVGTKYGTDTDATTIVPGTTSYATLCTGTPTCDNNAYLGNPAGCRSQEKWAFRYWRNDASLGMVRLWLDPGDITGFACGGCSSGNIVKCQMENFRTSVNNPPCGGCLGYTPETYDQTLGGILIARMIPLINFVSETRGNQAACASTPFDYKCSGNPVGAVNSLVDNFVEYVADKSLFDRCGLGCPWPEDSLDRIIWSWANEPNVCPTPCIQEWCYESLAKAMAARLVWKYSNIGLSYSPRISAPELGSGDALDPSGTGAPWFNIVKNDSNFTFVTYHGLWGGGKGGSITQTHRDLPSQLRSFFSGGNNPPLLCTEWQDRDGNTNGIGTVVDHSMALLYQMRQNSTTNLIGSLFFGFMEGVTVCPGGSTGLAAVGTTTKNIDGNSSNGAEFFIQQPNLQHSAFRLIARDLLDRTCMTAGCGANNHMLDTACSGCGAVDTVAAARRSNDSVALVVANRGIDRTVSLSFPPSIVGSAPQVAVRVTASGMDDVPVDCADINYPCNATSIRLRANSVTSIHAAATLPVPSIASLLPPFGWVCDPPLVTVNGTGFIDGDDVLIGAERVRLSCASGTCTFQAPRLGAAVVDVRVASRDDGTVSNPMSFTYLANPTTFTSTPAAPVDGYKPLTVQFQQVGSPTATYAWDFGDPYCSPQPSCRQGTGQFTSHTYGTQGMFDVTLSISVPGMCNGSVSMPQYVRVHDASTVENFVIGLGPGFANDNKVASFTYSTSAPTITPASANFFAYTAGHWGTNVAAARIDAPGVSASILTGPGPGAVFGPQVKAFKRDGSSRLINYFAYGTLKFGVNVGKGDVDNDVDYSEILTGAGPGAVFGPHVRGWNVDGASTCCPNVFPTINFFAYSTLKYGVNVSSGDVENADNCGLPTSYACTHLGFHDEILTGAGPGAVFAPHVRAFRHRPKTPTPPCCVLEGTPMNFFAYGVGAYGVEVAGGFFGDPDPDYAAADEVVTGRGPDDGVPNTLVRVFRYPNEPVTSIVAAPPNDPIVFGGQPYGTTVAAGDLTGDGIDEILAGVSAHPTPPTAIRSRVRGRRVDYTPAPPNAELLKLAPDLDFLPYGPVPSYGVTVAAVPLDEKFSIVKTQQLVAADERMRGARQFTASIPISTTPCDSCDPKLLQLAGTGWGEDAQREKALDKWDTLLEVLPDLALPSQVAGILDDIAALVTDPVKGVTNEMARVELLEQIATIRGSYDPPAFPSNAVTGLMTGIDEPSNLALSQPTDKLFVRPAPGKEGTVHVADARTLSPDPDRALPSGSGEIQRFATPTGRPEVYLVSKDVDDAGTITVNLERLSPAGVPVPDQGFVTLFSQGLPLYDVLVHAAVVTPPAGATSLSPDTAYLSLEPLSLTEIAVRPTLGVISGVRDFNGATFGGIFVPNWYLALVPSPVPGSTLLYGVTAQRIDAIDTSTSTVVEDVLQIPAGFIGARAIASGSTATGKYRAYVISSDQLLAYDPPQGAEPVLPSAVATLPGSAAAVTLSLDGRFVLVTRHIQASATRLVVLDADSLQEVRDSNLAACTSGPCPGSALNPEALTIDGSHAFVSNPEADLLDYVYITPPRLKVTATGLQGIVMAVPAEAFTKPVEQQKLENDAKLVVQFVGLAEKAPTEKARDALLTQAENRLATIVSKVDGCAGGDPDNDVIIATDCLDKSSVYDVATGLQMSIHAELPLSAPSMP